MTRPIEYIHNTTYLIKTIREHFPDQRFGQLIENLGGLNRHEEYAPLVHRLCEQANARGVDIDENDYLIWGNRGKDGKSKLQYVPISMMENDHIKAVLSTQGSIDPIMKEAMLFELAARAFGEECGPDCACYDDVEEMEESCCSPCAKGKTCECKKDIDPGMAHDPCKNNGSMGVSCKGHDSFDSLQCCKGKECCQEKMTGENSVALLSEKINALLSTLSPKEISTLLIEIEHVEA